MRFRLLLSSFVMWSSFLSALDLAIHLQELETDGFTVVKELFNKEDIQALSDSFQNVKKKAEHILNTTSPLVRHFSENDTENTSYYWKTENELILQAGEGRYDLYQGFKDGFFGSDSILRNETFEALMKELMKDDFTNYSGVIHSTAGSKDQYWHRDTHTLANSGSDGSKLVLLDDFYFTILIPLTVPFTIENGTTEFLKGSHRLGASHFDVCESVQRKVPLGSALIFNGKINHRGKANRSLEDRPALYIVYHKKWYNDQYRKGVL